MANKIENIIIDKIFIEDNRLWKVYDKDIDVLFQSIQEEGLITPIAVQERNGKYKLIAGEHRLTCCKKLGWHKIPAHIIEREYEEDEIEDARLTVLEADENLKRKYPDFIAEAHILEKRKEAYDKIMAHKCNGMDPVEYKINIGGKIGRLLNGSASPTAREAEEIEKLQNEMDSIKTFTKDTAEKTGASESCINQKLKVAKVIPEYKADEIKENNISAKTLSVIVVGKDEEETKKAAEIHLETIKDINSNLDKDTNINTLYQKAIKETRKELDRDFQRQNPVAFAEMVYEKVYEIIEVEEKKKQEKIYQLSQEDLDDINIALSMYSNIDSISITIDVDGKIVNIFDKFLK